MQFLASVKFREKVSITTYKQRRPQKIQRRPKSVELHMYFSRLPGTLLDRKRLYFTARKRSPFA